MKDKSQTFLSGCLAVVTNRATHLFLGADPLIIVNYLHVNKNRSGKYVHDRFVTFQGQTSHLTCHLECGAVGT